MLCNGQTLNFYFLTFICLILNLQGCKKQHHIKKLILLGGIIINVSSNSQNPIEDYFLIKNEEIIES